MSPIARLNYLNVGSGGMFAASGRYQSAARDVDDLVASLSTRRSKSLVIHFHGGLVPEEAGMSIAEKMISVYEAAGSHSLGVVWKTGFLDAIRDNLGDVARTRLFRRVLRLVLKLVLPHIDVMPGARGLGPSPTDGEIEAELSRGVPFAAWDAGVASPGAKSAGIPSEGMLVLQAQLILQSEAPMDPRADTAPQVDLAKLSDSSASPGERGIIASAKLALAAGKIAWRILRRMVGGHGHGLYPSTVEEILRELLLAEFGREIWTGMKQKASAMFADADSMGPRAGTYLVERLAALQKGPAPGLVIDVVGHSAGAIATAEMLTRGAKLGLRIRKVAFLAPAIRIDEFVKKVIPFHGAGNTFAQLRVFTMADEFEVRDHLVGPVYPRSLLYLISGVLEDDDGDTPLLGLERHIAFATPYVGGDFDKVKPFLHEDRANQLVLAKTSVYTPNAADDTRSDAEHHGDFDDDETTRTSLTRYLRLDVPK